MEKEVRMMASSQRYEELEKELGERLASYLSDQVEKKREKAPARRRKPAGNDGDEEMRDIDGTPPGGVPVETPQGDGVVGGNGGGVGGGAPPPGGDPSDYSDSDAGGGVPRDLGRKAPGSKSPKREHYEQVIRHIVDRKPVTDTPTPDPWKYSGAAKEDLREWVGLCEDYFTL